MNEAQSSLEQANNILLERQSALATDVPVSRVGRITVVRTSIVDVSAGFILHGCNAQGQMRSGVAKALREKWPSVFEVYRDAQPTIVGTDGLAVPGTLPMGTITHTMVAPGLWVLNGITQLSYGYDGLRYASYDAIADVFHRTALLGARVAEKTGALPPIHIPAIGMVRGGGNPRVILELFSSVFPSEFRLFYHPPQSDKMRLVNKPTEA